MQPDLPTGNDRSNAANRRLATKSSLLCVIAQHRARGIGGHVDEGLRRAGVDGRAAPSRQAPDTRQHPRRTPPRPAEENCTHWATSLPGLSEFRVLYGALVRASFIAELAHPASSVTASATIRIRIAFTHQEKADCITAAARIVLLYFIYTATLTVTCQQYTSTSLKSSNAIPVWRAAGLLVVSQIGGAMRSWSMPSSVFSSTAAVNQAEPRRPVTTNGAPRIPRGAGAMALNPRDHSE